MKPINDLLEKLSSLGLGDSKGDGENKEETFDKFLDFVKETLNIGQDQGASPRASPSEGSDDKQKTWSLPDFEALKSFIPGSPKARRPNRTMGKKNKSFGDVIENLIYSKTSKDGTAAGSRKSTVEIRAELVKYYRKKYQLQPSLDHK